MLMTFFACDRKPYWWLFTVLCIFVTLEPPLVKRVEYNVVIVVDTGTTAFFLAEFRTRSPNLKSFELKKQTICLIRSHCTIRILSNWYFKVENVVNDYFWHETEVAIFFSYSVTYFQVKQHLKWEGGTWFRPSGIDWTSGSWGVTNKMEADLKCQFADSGGGFLATGFTTDTQAWINVLFTRDDDHDQWHKTCLNSERERERETAWMTERILHQVIYSWNKLVCRVLRVILS